MQTITHAALAAMEVSMSRLLTFALTGFLALIVMPVSATAQGTEEIRYYHTDAIGSVRLVTDANGQVVERYDYLPFGEPWTATPAGTDTRRFGGKQLDGETGLDYFGARYYDSRAGRFTSADPLLDLEQAIAEPQLWNRYAYVTNNPHRFRDPDGRQREAAIDRDVYALLNKQITPEEYNARIQARGIGGAVGAVIVAGPIAWRVAISCFLSPSCQSVAVDALEGAAGGPPRITPLHYHDPGAIALARKLGGQASVAIEGFANEFDAVSAQYVGQTTGAVSALLKPGNYLSSSRRAQIKATLEAAKALGRKAYFEFTSGAHDEVIDYIRRNAERVGVEFVIDR